LAYSAESFLAPLFRRDPKTESTPESVRRRIQAVQVERALEHVPMIYAVACFNITLIMVLCFHKGLPLANYGWMGVVGILSFARMVMWIHRGRSPDPGRDPQRMLRILTVISLGLISGLSAWSVFALTTEAFANVLLIPVSLVFGSTCIAHCLAPIRRAAIGVLGVGVLPAALFMLLWGNFETAILGASMASIALLMTIFISESYQRIVDGIVMEDRIRTLAHTDPLTGLANRRAIMDALDEADREEAAYAVAMLDLDGFKQINDTHGHHVGDALLQTVAERLESAALPSEHVGRMGGDEFVILMPGVARRETAAARVTALLGALCRPADITDGQVPVAGSMGYALHPEDGADSDAILVTADRALYAAKRSRRKDDDRSDRPPVAGERPLRELRSARDAA
jgi:diguanylate cyclase (GGDEF)-like protein